MAEPATDDALLVEVGLTEREYLAALKRIEAQTTRTSKRNEDRFRRSNRRVTQSFDRANKSASSFANGGLRQASMQLSQVAQQGAATGNYLQALAIQAPDLALGFGAVGIAAGAVIPILYGVAQAAFGAEEALDKIDVQGAYDSATTALDKAREAQDRYTAAIRLSGVAQSEVTPEILGSLKLEAQAREALAAVEIARLERQRLALQESLEADRKKLQEIVATAETAASVGVFQLSDAEVAERVARAVEVAKQQNEDLLLKIKEQQAELDLVNSLIEQGHGEAAKLVDQLIEAATSADSTAAAAGNIAPNLETGVSAALRLAEALGISLKTAQALAALGPQGVLIDNADPSGKTYSGRGGDPREMGGSTYDRQNAEAIQFLENWTPPKKGRKAGGSKKKTEAQKEAEKEQNRLLSERDRILRDLETASQRYERKLADLNKLQEMGELTSEQYAAAVAKIGDEYVQAEFGAIISGIEDVSDAMAQAIVNGENMGEALGNVFKSIASDLISSGIKNVLMEAFSFGPGKSGGGFLGGIFSSLLPGRATGGTVSAGRPYMVGERGPEPFIPAVNGRVLSVSQAQQALRAGAPASGGGSMSINVNVSGARGNGEIMSMVQEGVSRGLRSYDGQLSRRFDSDGRMKDARMVR